MKAAFKTALMEFENKLRLAVNRAKTLNKSIFYVDHAAIESTHFTDVVTIVKDEEGSHIK